MRQCEHPLRVLRFAPAGALLGLLLLGLVGRPCLAETVTLQQGLTGYHGFIADEARQMGKTVEEVRNWRPAQQARARRGRRRRV